MISTVVLVVCYAAVDIEEHIYYVIEYCLIALSVIYNCTNYKLSIVISSAAGCHWCH